MNGSRPEAPAPAPGESRHTRAWTAAAQALGPLVALLIIYGFFAYQVPDSFPTLRTLENIARQTAIVGIGALGMTLIIIMGGIDLSAGSMVALCTVVIAWLLKYAPAGALADWPAAWPLLAACAGVLAGALCGLLNGALITGLRMVPFIVTLGTLLVMRGVAKGLAGEQKIDAPAGWLKEIMASLSDEQRWMVFPPGVWVMVLLAVLVALLLHGTRVGRHVFAIGSNEQTARLCGVGVNRVKVLVYALGGACAGLAGVMQFSRLTVGDPTVAVGLELDIIAAVVIGGGSLAGGEGSVLGSLVGALIMSSIRVGCSHMEIANWKQEMLTGAIIVTAVAFDRYRQQITAEGLLWFYCPWAYARRKRLRFTAGELLAGAAGLGLAALPISLHLASDPKRTWAAWTVFLLLAVHTTALTCTAAAERSSPGRDWPRLARIAVALSLHAVAWLAVVLFLL